MSKHDENILASKIGKLGGGELNKLGVQWVAKLLPNNAFEINDNTKVEFSSVCHIITNILSREGEILTSQENGDAFEVKAVIGSGYRNMNPAIVTVRLNEISFHHTHITIQGAAKEGLIKQHAGEKAARLVAQRLTEMLV